MTDSVSDDEARVDLHLHTDASDGTATLDERVEQAAERGLRAIAVTDHDTVHPGLEDRIGDSEGVELVTGVEVRADLFDTKIEVLGYFVDPDDPELSSLLATARDHRHERNREMMARVRDATDLDVTLDSLEREADGALGRPHVAEALVERGVVDSIGAAFDRYLGADGSCFVPMERVPFDEVIAAIHAADGLASLAHPGRIRTERIDEMVDRLVDAGLDGIEVWYPYGERSDDYADVGVEDAAALAETHGLLTTGGSDCHGPGSGKYRIGEVGVPAAVYDEMKRRADVV
jgi:hypothetical protein